MSQTRRNVAAFHQPLSSQHINPLLTYDVKFTLVFEPPGDELQEIAATSLHKMTFGVAPAYLPNHI